MGRKKKQAIQSVLDPAVTKANMGAPSPCAAQAETPSIALVGLPWHNSLPAFGGAAETIHRWIWSLITSHCERDGISCWIQVILINICCVPSQFLFFLLSYSYRCQQTVKVQGTRAAALVEREESFSSPFFQYNF